VAAPGSKAKKSWHRDLLPVVDDAGIWTADGTSNSTFDNRTFMNSLGVGYHLRYLQQVKAQFNVSFDFAGVWK
jgi:hypothetical protein